MNLSKIILNKFMKNKLALFGLCLVIIFIFIAIFAPLLSSYDPNESNISKRLLPPSKEHWFGTDELGRDVLSRMIYGSRISLSVGFIAIGIATIIGITVGAVSGYFGGITDQILMRFVDIVLTIPTLFLILMLIVFLGPSIFNVMLVIGLTGWTEMARLVRAEVLSLKKREFTQAAVGIGASNLRIIFYHILPNALSPVFVAVTFGVAGAILTESVLSFLGLGVQPPHASWGNILTSGRHYFELAWWLTAFPGIAIFVSVLSYNLLGEGLRDALDPRLIE